MGFCAATGAGGTGAARPARALLRLCLVAASAILSARAPGAAAAGGAVYVSAGQAGALAALSAIFRQDLAGTFYFSLATAESERAVMQRVAARPGDIGLAERDLYLRYRREDPKGAAALEFYGYVPACLVAVVRRGSAIRGFGDLVEARADRRLTLDVGPVAGAVAASYANLRRLDAALDHLELEHRGGSLALERVVNGATDAALRFVTPPFVDSGLEALRESGKIRLVPFASEAIALALARGKLPYTRRRIAFPPAGWFAGERSYEATCTELGVVVNARADPSLTEAIAGIILREARAAGERPWYRPLENAVAAMLDGFGALARNAVATVADWLGWPPWPPPGVALVHDAAGGR
ncbi:MAG TPA: hypothetical protein VGR91_18100 [Stellaceae bacterium]|nr:hypothetical protein [Stellaceae bacterium]